MVLARASTVLARASTVLARTSTVPAYNKTVLARNSTGLTRDSTGLTRATTVLAQGFMSRVTRSKQGVVNTLLWVGLPRNSRKQKTIIQTQSATTV